jgi:hypothetical protein
MRWIAFTAALTGFLLLSFAGSTSAADTTAACPLLTQAQIAAVFGGPVGAGAPIIVATNRAAGRVRWTNTTTVRREGSLA